VTHTRFPFLLREGAENPFGAKVLPM